MPESQVGAMHYLGSPQPGSSVPSSSTVSPATSGTDLAMEDDCEDGIPLRCRHVIRELIDTEGAYVEALFAIIEGYQNPMRHSLPFPLEEVDALFNNMAELHEFSKNLHKEMKDAQSDMVGLADCFLRNESSFKMYTTYCTGYPRSVEVLSSVQQKPVVAAFLKGCQLALGQMLPLGAYLLKPVQRILKYHLLLADLLKQYGKRFGTDNKEWQQLEIAQKTMGSVAVYINAMKRKHEASVRAQEIISQVVGWDTKLPTGSIVMEDHFRCPGRSGTHRILYMFEKLLLMAKKNKDNIMVYKGHILYENLTVAEGKEQLTFEVKSTISKSQSAVLIAKDEAHRSKWVIELRKLILENHPNLPESAKELMLKALVAKDMAELFKDAPAPTAAAANVTAPQPPASNLVSRPSSFRERTESARRTRVASDTESSLHRARLKAMKKLNRSKPSNTPTSGASGLDSDDDQPAAVEPPAEARPELPSEDKPEVFIPESHRSVARAKEEVAYSSPISVKSRRIQNAAVCDRWLSSAALATAQFRQQKEGTLEKVGSKEQLQHTVGLVSKLVRRYSELVDSVDVSTAQECTAAFFSARHAAASSSLHSIPGLGQSAIARMPYHHEKKVVTRITSYRTKQMATPAMRSSRLRRRESLVLRPVTRNTANSKRLHRSASFAGSSKSLAGVTLAYIKAPAETPVRQSGYFRREGITLTKAVANRFGPRLEQGCSFSTSKPAYRRTNPEVKALDGKVRSLIARFSVQPM